MTRFVVVGIVLSALGCGLPVDNRAVQSNKAREIAESVVFSDNAEIDNIRRRLELTSKPGLLGYIVLLNESGSPVMYTTVKGKVTSGSKRLTSPGYCLGVPGNECPSDEGTFGSSNPYVYFWDEGGRYHQWSGEYLYSDQPIRLRVEPLVVAVEK